MRPTPTLLVYRTNESQRTAPRRTYPAPEIEGRLVAEDGCVYLTASGEPRLLL